MTQTPFVGMPVLVPMPGGEEAYGIVSRVWTDDNVSVRVFGDDNEVGWRPGITLNQEREMDDNGNPVDDPMTCRVHPGRPADDVPADAPVDAPADAPAGDSTVDPAADTSATPVATTDNSKGK